MKQLHYKPQSDEDTPLEWWWPRWRHSKMNSSLCLFVSSGRQLETSPMEEKKERPATWITLVTASDLNLFIFSLPSLIPSPATPGWWKKNLETGQRCTVLDSVLKQSVVVRLKRNIILGNVQHMGSVMDYDVKWNMAIDYNLSSVVLQIY